jgi:hypothetical protein
VGATGTVNSTTAITVNAAAATGAVNLQNIGNFTVTGLGTAANGNITEAATHTTGTLGVTTASNLAGTVTLNAAGTGAATITHAGTGALALVTAGTRSVTVNVTGATGSVTDTGSTATTYNITAGAHLVTAGSANDTISVTGTGTSVETINGGAGADSITFGTTAAHVVYQGVDAATAATSTGVLIGQGTAAVTGAFNAAGMDVITGFGTGMTVNISSDDTVLNNFGTTLIRNGVALADGSVGLIVGNYDAATKVFTVAPTGTSSMFVFDDTAGAAGTVYRGIILVGYVDLAANDTISAAGLFTSVAG